MAYKTVGVDIGTALAKIVQLSRSGRFWQLEAFNTTEIPNGCWGVDEIKNIDALATSLKETLNSAKPQPVSAKNAMIALPETVVMSGLFSFSNINETDMRQALPFEVADKLSINVEDYLFDFERVTTNYCRPSTEETESKTVKEKDKDADDAKKPAEKPNAAQPQAVIFAVAAKKTLINSVVELVNKLGLEIAGIDIKPAAIIRSLIPASDGQSRVVADLGGATVCVAATEGGYLRLSSTIPTGIKAMLGNSELKPEIVSSKLSPVFDEVIHIAKYFENRVCPGLKVKEIILIGTGSNLPEITTIFKKETGFPAVLGNPFQMVQIGRNRIDSDSSRTYADAIGLAMRSFND